MVNAVLDESGLFERDGFWDAFVPDGTMSGRLLLPSNTPQSVWADGVWWVVSIVYVAPAVTGELQ